MTRITITRPPENAPLRGHAQIPPSKSHTMRAILLASLAKGESVLEGLLDSPDAEAMRAACVQWGAVWQPDGEQWRVRGVAARPRLEGEVDSGNSGQVLRFVTAMGALGQGAFSITGDSSILQNRPVDALVEALRQAGAHVQTAQGRPPLQVQGPLRASEIVMGGQDSQPVSAMVMALAMAEGRSCLRVHGLGERPWIGLTLWWLERLGARIEWQTLQQEDRFLIPGGWVPSSWRGSVPADWSSAAFPIAAGLLGAQMVLEGLDPTDPQGDRRIVPLLQSMGADLVWQDGAPDVLVARRSTLKGGVWDCNDLIDAVPILCALGPSCQEGVRLENVAIARRKESDRLEAMAEGLQRLGARVALGQDWIQVWPSLLRGGEVESYGDHRVAMALAIAALAATGPVSVRGGDCVQKSYPGFWQELSKWGASVEGIESCSLC